MSTTKHTPGPWFISYEHQGGTRLAIDDEPGMQGERDYDLATVTHGDPDELRANAQLIAAAPDLLEAAKLVIAWYEAEDDHSKADFYQRMEMCRESEAACRAAIAKATGSTT